MWPGKMIKELVSAAISFAGGGYEESFTVMINRRDEFVTNLKTYFDKCKHVINEFMLTAK